MRSTWGFFLVAFALAVVRESSTMPIGGTLRAIGFLTKLKAAVQENGKIDDKNLAESFDKTDIFQSIHTTVQTKFTTYGYNEVDYFIIKVVGASEIGEKYPMQPTRYAGAPKSFKEVIAAGGNPTKDDIQIMCVGLKLQASRFIVLRYNHITKNVQIYDSLHDYKIELSKDDLANISTMYPGRATEHVKPKTQADYVRASGPLAIKYAMLLMLNQDPKDIEIPLSQPQPGNEEAHDISAGIRVEIGNMYNSKIIPGYTYTNTKTNTNAGASAQ